MNNAQATRGDVKNGFTSKSNDGLNLSHTPITIHVDVDSAFLFIAQITGGVADINPKAVCLRMIHGLTGAIFRIIGMRSQRRNGDLHPDMKGHRGEDFAKLCLVGGAEQANAAPFAWTKWWAPEPDQMACFGELSGAHCLRRRAIHRLWRG